MIVAKNEEMDVITGQLNERVFDHVWSELENRHGWSIEVTHIDNPKPRMSRIPFHWQDYDNRNAVRFREENNLASIIENAKSDWEAVLMMRHWVFTNMINGTNACLPRLEPFALLSAARAGGTFFCTQFATVFVAVASSLGFVARKLGVDGEHLPSEASNMHGVADIWVDSLNKWVCVDPNYDHHYEYEGVPLNAEEVGQRWQIDQGEGVQAVVGPKRQKMPRGRRGIHGKGEACSLFWHHIETQCNVFRRDGHGAKDSTVLLVDEARKKLDWYQGKPPRTFKHRRYERGTFLITENYDDAYPDLNAAYFEMAEPHKMPYYCKVQFYTPCAPNFSHYEICVDGEAPVKLEGTEYPWRLHPGNRTFSVCAVNLAGRRGREYSISIVVREEGNKSPAWPWADKINPE